nr:hypothetical protein CFP56_20572 [Quercus suber]
MHDEWREARVAYIGLVGDTICISVGPGADKAEREAYSFLGIVLLLNYYSSVNISLVLVKCKTWCPPLQLIGSILTITMAESNNQTPPSDVWQTDTESSGDDDMDFELANEPTPSGLTEDMDEDEYSEETGGDGTTLYFDAEEGVLRTRDGDAVTFNVESHTEEEEEAEGEDEAEDEDNEAGDGARTPQAARATAASGTQQGVQTIRSTSFITLLGASAYSDTTSDRGRRCSLATQ